MDLDEADLERISAALVRQWAHIDDQLDKVALIGATETFAPLHAEGIEVRRLLGRIDDERRHRVSIRNSVAETMARIQAKEIEDGEDRQA